MHYVTCVWRHSKNLLTNIHQSLEANQSLSLPLRDPIHHRLIVETAETIEIVVNGSCLILLKEELGAKPTFSNHQYLQGLIPNEKVSSILSSGASIKDVINPGREWVC